MALWKPDLAEATDLWADYRINPSVENRNRLVVFYLPLAKRAGIAMSKGKPHNVEAAELAGYAAFRLITHIELYDPTAGPSFEQYIVPHLTQGIIDEMRDVDWQSRTVRNAEKTIERATATLIGMAKAVTPEALGVVLNLPEAKIKTMLAVIGRTQVGLEINDDDGGNRVLRPIASSIPGPAEVTDLHSEADVLLRSLKKLTRREAQVVYLYDFRGLTLAVIGVRLGITEGGVSLMHRKAVQHLQQLFAAEGLLQDSEVMESNKERANRIESPQGREKRQVRQALANAKVKLARQEKRKK